MEAPVLQSLAPLASPLADAPQGEVFTPEQWSMLTAICDVFISSLVKSSGDTMKSLQLTDTKHDAVVAQLATLLPEGVSTELAEEYLAESVASQPAFKESVRRRFSLHVPLSMIAGLRFVLTALNTRLGSLLLTGSATPLHQQPLLIRTSIVCNWSVSRLAPLRAVHRSLCVLAKQTWVGLSPTLPRLIDFTDVPKHIERNPTFEYDFKNFSDGPENVTLSTDVLIIGSGCGAGVLASHLSHAGLKVLVVDKSYHYPSSHFPMSTSVSGEHQMENGGIIISDDASIAVLAGSTWGGGGTVNWSASLQPQHFVREEWSSAPHSISLFTSPVFQDCLDTICTQLGVARSTDHSSLNQIAHNFSNRTLLEGARRLGLAAQTVPQNSGGKDHTCGAACMRGCASATKQSPANYWFPKAASQGADFIEGCFVSSLLFSANTPQRVTGARAIWTSRDRLTTRELTIKARRTIISAGTLHSPLLLLRSGLTNPHIGSYLHLHPTSCLGAVWPQRVEPWEGSILTAAVTALENHDGLGHGPKLECTVMTPYYTVPWMPWSATASRSASTTNPDAVAESALDFKLKVAKWAHMTGWISIHRDRDEGKVYIDPNDPERKRVRISYTTSKRDREGLVAGVVAAARMAYTMGAIEIDAWNGEYPRFVRSAESASRSSSDGTPDIAFETWLDGFKAVGLSTPEPCSFGSAHQMGTCRMSSNEDQGVVDMYGRVWGTEGLYVGDASVFPSASGVNPMVTTMGIAEFIARGIVKETKGE